MSVFVVETYLVESENREGFKGLWRRIVEYMERKPELFREVKSLRLFTQMFGGIAGRYMEMWEFETITDLEKCWKREEKDEGFMALHQEFLSLIDSTTLSIDVWNSVT